MSTLSQKLERAQNLLGPSAMVEYAVLASEGERVVMWYVGTRGKDLYSWSVLGVSTKSFEHALALAVRHQTRKGK